MPLLVRPFVLDAVQAAQALAGGPVTSQEARAAALRPVLRHARAFSAAAAVIARLGPDEHGRSLRAVGRDRKGVALWWVETEVARGPAA
jgi:hypothetical protein